MEAISDILLAGGALAAAFYCMILARRLRRFTDLERGMGGAVAVLSAQVDDLSRTLIAAKEAAGSSSGTLEEITTRAEQAARRLELLVASLHDLPQEEAEEAPANGQAQRARGNGKHPYFLRNQGRLGPLT